MPNKLDKFKELSQVYRFARKYSSKHYKRGESVYDKDDNEQYVYLVRSGHLKISDISDTGKEQLVWIANQYDVTPIERIASPTAISTFYCTAFTDTSLYKIPADEFKEFIADKPYILNRIIFMLVLKQQHLLRHVNSLKKESARDKLLYTLDFIRDRFGVDSRTKSYIELPVTHQDIADMSGLSRKTVSITLKFFSDNQIVSYGPTKFVINSRKLDRVLTNEEPPAWKN